MEFANKEYLLLLLLLIPYVLWYFLYKKNRTPSLRMSTTRAYRYAPRSLRVRLLHLPMLLRCLAFALVVLVLARPQTFNALNQREVEGIDIMLAMDVSTSMLAEDVSPNRMEAAKDVAAGFIAGRPNDNIGLTIFAGEAFTQCPLTTDHASLLNLLHAVRPDLAASGLIDDGTAVGMGLSNAVSRLKDQKVKSKVVILLTDGSNNMGDISPLTAADIAKQFGVRVYTIGLGTNGIVRYPVTIGGTTQYMQGRGEIDYETLRKIAEVTDGNFYRAASRGELQRIYHDIDKLEKTKLTGSSYARRYEAYQPFAVAALLLLVLEVLLRLTWLKQLPQDSRAVWRAKKPSATA